MKYGKVLLISFLVTMVVGCVTSDNLNNNSQGVGENYAPARQSQPHENLYGQGLNNNNYGPPRQSPGVAAAQMIAPVTP